jgi:hypothetical protein
MGGGGEFTEAQIRYRKIQIYKSWLLKIATFLHPAADLTENTQRYHEIYSVHLPICTLARLLKRSASIIVEFFLAEIRMHIQNFYFKLHG